MFVRRSYNRNLHFFSLGVVGAWRTNLPVFPYRKEDDIIASLLRSSIL